VPRFPFGGLLQDRPNARRQSNSTKRADCEKGRFASLPHQSYQHFPAPRATLILSIMAISKELLEILVCPVCKATVELKSDQSGLKCVECHRVYPVRDDIPVMLVDEAKIED
jgi:uncharacterized protein YbaR (Trm112 family)